MTVVALVLRESLGAGAPLALAVAAVLAVLAVASVGRRRLVWWTAAVAVLCLAARAFMPIGLFPPVAFAFELPRDALASPLRLLVPAPESALLLGMVLGERGDIPSALSDAFKASGTTHLLAISGFNMTLVAAAVALVLRGRVRPAVRAAVAVASIRPVQPARRTLAKRVARGVDGRRRGRRDRQRAARRDRQRALRGGRGDARRRPRDDRGSWVPALRACHRRARAVAGPSRGAVRGATRAGARCVRDDPRCHRAHTAGRGRSVRAHLARVAARESGVRADVPDPHAGGRGHKHRRGDRGRRRSSCRAARVGVRARSASRSRRSRRCRSRRSASPRAC